eukprot:TRINITY_DN26101_c0_g1_i1.p1 TRINITY_DN26101_c0_g1~~TRINITY_DN26101_c0_g1_i1.p1  ORF type:complete len:221 (+),score=0.16 TRINITY_DN26101_c0_g1_i1:72-734(+)
MCIRDRCRECLRGHEVFYSMNLKCSSKLPLIVSKHLVSLVHSKQLEGTVKVVPAIHKFPYKPKQLRKLWNAQQSCLNLIVKHDCPVNKKQNKHTRSKSYQESTIKAPLCLAELSQNSFKPCFNHIQKNSKSSLMIHEKHKKLYSTLSHSKSSLSCFSKHNAKAKENLTNEIPTNYNFINIKREKKDRIKNPGDTFKVKKFSLIDCDDTPREIFTQKYLAK